MTRTLTAQAAADPIRGRRSGSDGGATVYLLADHLSSSQAEASGSGAELAQRRADPFGSDRPVSGASDLTRDERYTGQIRVEAGAGNPRQELYHYGARFYRPGVGLFTQPDTVVPDARDPQALNRYSYCLNNPLKYVDPTGFDPLGSAWEAEWAAAHPGQMISDVDRRDRLYSVIFPGSGEGEAWTSEDWARYGADREGFWTGTAEPTRGASGVDSFAEHLGRLAAWYRRGEEAAFALAIGLVWGGIPSQIGGALQAAGGPVYTPLQEGHGNWRPELIDEGETNQSHHYAGLFYVGFFYSEWAVYLVNRARDYDNAADIALGDTAVRHGAMLAQRIISIAEVALAFRYAVDARPGIWPGDTPGARWPRYWPR